MPKFPDGTHRHCRGSSNTTVAPMGHTSQPKIKPPNSTITFATRQRAACHEPPRRSLTHLLGKSAGKNQGILTTEGTDQCRWGVSAKSARVREPSLYSAVGVALFAPKQSIPSRLSSSSEEPPVSHCSRNFTSVYFFRTTAQKLVVRFAQTNAFQVMCRVR